MPDPTARRTVWAALLHVAAEMAATTMAAFANPAALLERLDALAASPVHGVALLRRTIVYLPTVVLLVLAARQ